MWITATHRWKFEKDIHEASLLQCGLLIASPSQRVEHHQACEDGMLCLLDGRYGWLHEFVISTVRGSAHELITASSGEEMKH